MGMPGLRVFWAGKLRLAKGRASLPIRGDAKKRIQGSLVAGSPVRAERMSNRFVSLFDSLREHLTPKDTSEFQSSSFSYLKL